MREKAPSVMRPDAPVFARTFALLGLVGVTVGGASILTSYVGWHYLVPPGLGIFLLTVGTIFLLYHAFREKDIQYRRLYGLVALVLIATGVIARVIPPLDSLGMKSFLPLGAPALLAGLLFLLTLVRNETDEFWRSRAIALIGIIGALNAFLGFALGFWKESFLVGHGVIHLLLGLVYLWAYVAIEGPTSERGYWAGFTIAGVGGMVMVLALVLYFGVRFLNVIGLSEATPSLRFFVPSGLILLYMGFEYFLVGITSCSDNRLVLLFKREMQAYFFSPIAYIVLIGLTLVAWVQFWGEFLEPLIEMSQSVRGPGSGIMEPIFAPLIISLAAIIAVIFMVPILTMRLISEEKRTGTLEVLLTAPVNETPVVLAKFLAAWRFFLLCWYPWAVFLVALRIEGGQEFDFRPALTFFISLAAMGAGFVAMGLFFSSLTNNQIVGAILTFAGMMGWTMMYFIKRQQAVATSWAGPIFDFVSYIDVWATSAQGYLLPRQIVFHGCVAVFWLFLTVKVLESRKWR